MRRSGRPLAVIAATLLAGASMGAWGAALLPAPAGATACSTSSGNASCTISTSVTVAAGTLTLESSPNLFWAFALDGADQWASGSATALSGCVASAGGTTCSGGSAPRLEVLDATGSGSGWALSAYLSGNDLPTGSVFHFNGTGSATFGNSQNAAISADPFAGTTPGAVCDFASGCTVATPASTCSHPAIGFSSCPTYPVNVATGTGATTQVDLYSAAAGTGKGAVCLASGTATGTGCAGSTTADDFNIGIPSGTAIGTYNTTTITVTASSGP